MILKMKYRMVFVFLVCFTLIFVAACGGGAQESTSNSSADSENSQENASSNQEQETSFPEDDVTMIVPFSPGGGFDTAGRQIAKTMSNYLDPSVIVENVPGGGQKLGATQFARTEADGYTMIYPADAGLYTGQLLESDAKFDVMSWEWIGAVRGMTAGIVVPQDSPYETLDDLINANEHLRIPDIGVGSGYFPLHVVMIESLGLDASILTGYGGTSEMVPALLRGEADVSLITPITSGLKWVESGDLRVLAVVNDERLDYLPDAPAITEFDLPSLDLLEVRDYYGLALPEGTPEENKMVLQDALEKTLSDEEFLAWAEEVNIKNDITFIPGEELTEIKKTAYETYQNYESAFEEYASSE